MKFAIYISEISGRSTHETGSQAIARSAWGMKEKVPNPQCCEQPKTIDEVKF